MNEIEQTELYNESIKRFIALRLELGGVFRGLDSYEHNSAFENIKVGIYKHIKKLIPCFDILFKVSQTSSIQSLMTLERMIIDNYAILYLLTIFSSKEEQLLRYYLFLLDAICSRSNILKNFSSNIKYEMPAKAYEDADSAIIYDKKASIELNKKINEIQQKLSVNTEIIKNSNWKFKDIEEGNQNINRLSWTDLYKNAGIPNHHAQLLQKYNSSFVHGLGISLMIESEDNLLPFKISTLELCSILMSRIIKIIMIEFQDETKTINLNSKTIDFINHFWDNWS
jgi:hypothetical protein